MVIKTADQLQVVALADILWVESLGMNSPSVYPSNNS